MKRKSIICSGVVLVFAGLAGCASYPSQIQPGMTEDAVRTQFGAPALSRPYGEDSVLIYPTGPFGQFTFAVTLGPDHRVVRVDQVLTEQNFARIEVGVWNKERVLDLIGPPVEKVRFRGYDEVWNYRYKESGYYNSLMSVMFDANGIVQRYENGPDPMFDRLTSDGVR